MRRAALAATFLMRAAMGQERPVEIVPGSVVDRPFAALRDGHPVNMAICETEDRMIAVTSRMPYILLRESVEVQASWRDLEARVLDTVWTGAGHGYYWIDLSKHLPPDFVRREWVASSNLASPQVSRANGGWKILVTGTNGQTAVVDAGSRI